MQPVEFLHRNRLRPARLLVDFDAPEARQDVRDLTVYQGAAVEFGQDVHGQPQLPPRRLNPQMVGNGADQIAAEQHHGAHRAVDDLLAGLHDVDALLLGHLDAEQLFELLRRHHLGLLGDSYGALPLHIGVAAHGADAGAGSADIAAHQGQIDHGLHGLGALLVLCQPHAINEHGGLGVSVNVGGRLQGIPGEARAALDLGPSAVFHRSRELFPAMGVFVDEFPVDHRPLRIGHVLQREKGFGDPHHGGGVAAGPDLMILRGDAGRRIAQHLRRRLRIDELLKSPLPQGIEGHDGNTAAGRFLQLMQHPRTRSADILAKEEDTIGLREIVQGAGADRHADALGQRHRGGLMAHVGTVGQIVGAESAREQPVHERCFERSPAGGVEHDAVRLQCPQFASDLRGRRLPNSPGRICRSRHPTASDASGGRQPQGGDRPSSPVR